MSIILSPAWFVLAVNPQSHRCPEHRIRIIMPKICIMQVFFIPSRNLTRKNLTIFALYSCLWIMLQGTCANKYTTNFITDRHQNLGPTCWLKCPRHTFYDRSLSSHSPLGPWRLLPLYFVPGCRPKHPWPPWPLVPSKVTSLQQKNHGGWWT